MKALGYVASALIGLILGCLVAWCAIPLVDPSMGIDRMWLYVDAGSVAGLLTGVVTAGLVLRKVLLLRHVVGAVAGFAAGSLVGWGGAVLLLPELASEKTMPYLLGAAFVGLVAGSLVARRRVRHSAPLS